MASAASSFAEGTPSSVHPLIVNGRRDHGSIARVVFLDGHSIDFPAAVESITTTSSSITASSPRFFSHSPSQQQGRDRGESFGTELSSTGSTRETFKGLSVGPSQPIAFPTNTEAATSHFQPTPWTAYDSTHASQMDYVGLGEDWASQPGNQFGVHQHETVDDPAGFWTGEGHSQESQSQLVANADGPSQDVFGFDDLDTAFDGITNHQQTSFSPIDLPPPKFHAGPISSSAPATTGWISRARRTSGATHSFTKQKLDEENATDHETVTSARAKSKPGRAKGSKLPDDKRKKVAAMRVTGACAFCKAGRRCCDQGTPCRPCVLHYGPELLDDVNQCRRPLVSSLSKQILDVRWHPHPRSLLHFFGGDFYVTTWSLEIPIYFGFGPPLRRAVQILETSNPSLLSHEHVNYPAPSADGSVGFPSTSHDYVLPVTFSRHGDLLMPLDRHITMLVSDHFPSFSLPGSHLQIYDKVFNLYLHYRSTCTAPDNAYAGLLLQSLKLLVLVHCAHDISVPISDSAVHQILHRFAPGYAAGQKVTPCLLRAELAGVMEQLAGIILEDVLNKGSRVALARRCEQFPVVLAVWCVLMGVIESIMHTSPRLGYHAHSRLSAHSPAFSSTTCPVESSAGLASNLAAASSLLNLYWNCFENCHRATILGGGDVSSLGGFGGRGGGSGGGFGGTRGEGSKVGAMTEKQFARLRKEIGEVPARFVAAVNGEVGGRWGYLEGRAGMSCGQGGGCEGEGGEKGEKIDEEVKGGGFDGLVARLLLLRRGAGEGV